MYCSHCGRKMEQNTCSYCGYENEHPENKKVNQVKSKKLYVLIGVIMFAFAGVILCITLLGKSESEMFLEYLKEGSYNEAYSYYHTNLVTNENELQKTYNYVVDEIDELIKKYYVEQISYDDAKNGLSIYSEFYGTEVENAIAKIEDMKKSKEIFDLAEQMYNEERYKEAYNYYAEVIAEDSNYTKARERMHECYSFVGNQIFSNAEEAILLGNYLEAIEQLEKEWSFLTEEDKAVANEKIQEYEQQYIAEELKKVNSYLSAEDYDSCYKLLKELKTSWTDDIQISEVADSVNSSYIEHISNKVELLIQERDFVSGVEIMNQALVNLPDNEMFLQLKEKVMDYFPIKLQDVYLFDSQIPGTKKVVDNPRDMYQNEYEQGILYYDTSYQDYNKNDGFVYKEREEIYLLNKEYTHFTATITPSEKWTREGLGEEYGTAQFTIYGDGVQLFRASIWRDTKPISIDIDVTGVEKLEIAFYRGNEGYFLLAEPYIYKSY